MALLCSKSSVEKRAVAIKRSEVRLSPSQGPFLLEILFCIKIKKLFVGFLCGVLLRCLCYNFFSLSPTTASILVKLTKTFALVIHECCLVTFLFYEVAVNCN